MLLRNRFLASLAPADLASILPITVEVALARDEVLYEPGQRAEHVYFPSNALISQVTLMRDGRAVDTATIGYESIVGALLALSGGKSHARVFVQAAGQARRLPAVALRQLAAARPAVLERLMIHALQDAAMSEQCVACNALHPAADRLARWLLMTQDRLGSPTLPLTQEYLAMMLGVQRTTVTALAQALQSAGLIRYRRGSVEILDREGVEARSCECYAVDRGAFEPAFDAPMTGLRR